MSEKENLTPFQIQLLLYYLTAEPSKRTVTDSARSLNVSKWVVTRTLDTLDTLEKLNIVERLENRKTVLTVPGVKLAEKYQKQKKVLEKYMQYQDILLHGSVCLKMQCSVGDMHMPESTAVFTMFIH